MEATAHIITPAYVTVQQAKEISGMGKDMIRSLCDRGYIDVYSTPGGHRRISRASLERYIRGDDNKTLEIMHRMGLK